jgi:hypothetical protein
MTFHLAAFETPAHFRPTTNHLSRKRSPLTPVGNSNMHAPVFAYLIGGRSKHRPISAEQVARQMIARVERTKPEVTTFRARGRCRCSFRGKPLLDNSATGGTAQRSLLTTGG